MPAARSRGARSRRALRPCAATCRRAGPAPPRCPTRPSPHTGRGRRTRGRRDPSEPASRPRGPRARDRSPPRAAAARARRRRRRTTGAASGSSSSGSMRDGWNGRPSRSARFMVASPPASQRGGPPGVYGSGDTTSPAGIRWNGPSCGRPHQSACSATTASSKRTPRSSTGTPRNANSRSQKPGATTSTKRPSVITSSVAACLATFTTSRSGSTAAVRPTRPGSTAPANQLNSVNGSSVPDQPGKSALASRPSPSQSVSMPPSTAVRAMRSAPCACRRTARSRTGASAHHDVWRCSRRLPIRSRPRPGAVRSTGVVPAQGRAGARSLRPEWPTGSAGGRRIVGCVGSVGSVGSVGWVACVGVGSDGRGRWGYVPVEVDGHRVRNGRYTVVTALPVDPSDPMPGDVPTHGRTARTTVAVSSPDGSCARRTGRPTRRRRGPRSCCATRRSRPPAPASGARR